MFKCVQITCAKYYELRYRKPSIKCRVPNNRRVNTELSEYQPYTSYVIATPTLSADTDKSLYFLAN